jgi:hypothetical protein
VAHRRHGGLVLACRAEKAGVPVMFLAPGGGAQIARVAERHPQLQLIADHMGMSLSVEAVRAGNFQGPIGETLALAKYPNVSVKLSGSANYSRQPYPYADLNPHIRRLFEAYGPQRSYWGTDITNGAWAGDLPPAHHALHRGARLHERGRPGLGDGPRHSGAAEVVVIAAQLEPYRSWLNQSGALASCLSMILSENRYPLVGIMLYRAGSVKNFSP